MFIVEGTNNKQKISKDTVIILSKNFQTEEPELYSSKLGIFKLKNNLVSVDIVSEEAATGGGVGGAAGGAVLGFLIAGPLGTAVGAGLGSKKKGSDNTTLVITWVNGDVWVVDRVKPEELSALKVAVATSAPKVLPKARKKLIPKKKSRNTKTGKKELEKLPSRASALKFHEGRSAKDKTSMPDLSYLEKFKNLEGVEEAVKLFNSIFSVEIENYNNWKWQYFDLKIETEKEVNAVAQYALKKLIVASNEASQVKDNTRELETEIENLKQAIEEESSELKKKDEDLAKAGFFSRGKIKQERWDILYRLDKLHPKVPAKKGALTKLNKKLASTREIRSIKNANEEFAAIYNKAFPDEKGPSKSLKSKIEFDNDFFLATYREVFDETRDKRTSSEINKVKKLENDEEKTEEIKEKVPSVPKLSKKEQLYELKELLDEGLITNEEFEESRKNILGLK